LMTDMFCIMRYIRAMFLNSHWYISYRFDWLVQVPFCAVFVTLPIESTVCVCGKLVILA